MISKLLGGKSEYTKNILTLITGTGVAQLIPIAVSPILTRLYSPEDFGLIALYLSLVSIITVLCTCRYEMALMLPKKDSEVNGVVKLITIMVVCSSLFFLFLFLFFSEKIALFLGNELLSNWLYLIPLSIVLTALFQVLNYLLIREEQFKNLASNKVVSSACNASAQLGVGYTLNSSWGLLLGHIANLSISILLILRLKSIRKYFRFSKSNARIAANEYKKFPLYDMPAILINLFANQIPLLILGKFFGLGVLGAYSFMYKTLMLPIGLISNSVLDVFKKKATVDFQNDGHCIDIYMKTLKRLVLLGVVPFTGLAFIAPELFAFIFGAEWRLAGEFAQYMAPMFFLNFIANPLSYTFFIAGKQSANLKGQVLILGCSILSALIGYFFNDVYLFFLALSSLNCLIYILYIYLSFRYARGVDATSLH